MLCVLLWIHDGPVISEREITIFAIIIIFIGCFWWAMLSHYEFFKTDSGPSIRSFLVGLPFITFGSLIILIEYIAKVKIKPRGKL